MLCKNSSGNHGAMRRLHGKRSAVRGKSARYDSRAQRLPTGLGQLRPAARKNTGKLRRVFLVGSPDDTSKHCGSTIEAQAERELRGCGVTGGAGMYIPVTGRGSDLAGLPAVQAQRNYRTQNLLDNNENCNESG